MANSLKSSSLWAFCPRYPGWGWGKVIQTQGERVQILFENGQRLCVNPREEQVEFSHAPPQKVTFPIAPRELEIQLSALPLEKREALLLSLIPFPSFDYLAPLLKCYLEKGEREKAAIRQILQCWQKEELLLPLLAIYEELHPSPEVTAHKNRLLAKWQNRLPKLAEQLLPLSLVQPLPFSLPPLPFYRRVFLLYWQLLKEEYRPCLYFFQSRLFSRLLLWLFQQGWPPPRLDFSLFPAAFSRVSQNLSVTAKTWQHLATHFTQGWESLWLEMFLTHTPPSHLFQRAHAIYPHLSPLWSFLHSSLPLSAPFPRLSQDVLFILWQHLPKLEKKFPFPLDLFSQLIQFGITTGEGQKALFYFTFQKEKLKKEEKPLLYGSFYRLFSDLPPSLQSSFLPLLTQLFFESCQEGILPSPLPPLSPHFWEESFWASLSSSMEQAILKECQSQPFDKKDFTLFCPKGEAGWKRLLSLVTPSQFPAELLASSSSWSDWLCQGSEKIQQIRRKTWQITKERKELQQKLGDSLEREILPYVEEIVQKSQSPFLRGHYTALLNVLRRSLPMWQEDFTSPKEFSHWELKLRSRDPQGLYSFFLFLESKSREEIEKLWKQYGEAEEFLPFVSLHLALERYRRLSAKEGRRWILRRLRTLAEEYHRQNWYHSLLIELIGREPGWIHWIRREPFSFRKKLLAQCYRNLWEEWQNFLKQKEEDSLASRMRHFVRELSPVMNALEAEFSQYERLRYLFSKYFGLFPIEPVLGTSTAPHAERHRLFQKDKGKETWVRTHGVLWQGQILSPAHLEGNPEGSKK